MAIRGLNNREVAAKMRIEEQSVKNLLHIVYEKLSVKNRVQLTLKIIRLRRRRRNRS